MRQTVFVVVLCTFLAAPVWAGLPYDGAGYNGGTAYWDQKADHAAGYGGEFTFGGPGLLLSNAAYAPTTRGVNVNGWTNSFQTFCIEVDENIWWNRPVNIWVSTANAAGTAAGSHAWLGGANTNSGDDLDPRTAYLYTQFATGNLAGYTYSGLENGLNRSQTAAVLQRVIWRIENEDGVSGTPWTTSFEGIQLSGYQVTLADAWLALTPDSWIRDGKIGDVRVLQTWYHEDGIGTDFRQDQLYLTPVPAAVLLGLLGLSAAGLKLRKFA